MCVLNGSQFSFAQNYDFNGTISREVLDNYLDRAISMQTISETEGVGLQPEIERMKDINMLNDIGAKFISRMAHWRENGWGQTNHDNFFAKVQQNVLDIKSNDPQVICQAAVFEYVSATIETFWIPDYVWNEFGISPPANHRLDYESMLYPAPASQYKIYGRDMTESERQSMPDITQVSTQMWFYYMATRFISVGCEAMHFGQAEIMNRRDIGNKKFWELLNRIRSYAATRNRGVILCDAHVPSGGMYFEPTLNISISSWQNYKYIEDWYKQLVWDFHSIWVGYEETLGCTSALQPVVLNPYPDKGLHQRSLGGLHPKGWYIESNPYLVEFDNYGIGEQVGCNATPSFYLYGWDEISWFAAQPEYYRNNILKYTYYKIKCMDKNGHLNMPGRRNINLTPGGLETIYRANTGNFNQQITIKNIWNGQFASPQGWVRMDYTDNYISTPPQPAIAQKNLIFVGSKRMYYIGTDQRIHGYIKHGDVWLTVSPSWSAHSNGQSINSQQLVNNKLVCSPNNQTISYLGTDNELHGFEINSDWSYSYFNFKNTPSNKKPRESLIFSQDNQLFYIASILGDNKVHFLKFGDDHCKNQAVQNIEPNCCMYLVNDKENDIYSYKNIDLVLKTSYEDLLADKEFYLQIYPNPSSQNTINLTVTGLSHNSEIVVIITDLIGKVYLNKQVKLENFLTLLDIQNLPSGFYIVMVKSKHLAKTTKLIVSK